MRMESSIKRTKRKKSGAENRDEQGSERRNEKLGMFMKSYFTKSSKSYEDDASSNDREPLNAAKKQN